MSNLSTLLLGAVIGSTFFVALQHFTIEKIETKLLRKSEEDTARLYEFKALLLRWIRINNDDNSIGKYLYAEGYSSVAVYGFGEIGRELVYELKKEKMDVKCIIDKQADQIKSDLLVVDPKADIPKSDLVIVTVLYCYDEIEEYLSKKMNCPIISLDDLVCDIYKKMNL